MKNAPLTRTYFAVATALLLLLAACTAPDNTEDTAAEPEVEETSEEPEPEPEADPEPEPEPEPEADPEPEPESDDTPIGSSAMVGDYEITVTEFVEDATERVLGDNQFNDDPSNGFYGTVTFDATYLGDGEGMPGFDLAAKLVIDGVQHSDSECGASVDGGGMDAPTLENGGTATDITFCFDHPGLNDDARLFFEELMSFDDDRAYWAVS